MNALLLSLATVFYFLYFLGDIRAAIVIAIMVILAITTAFRNTSQSHGFSESPIEQLVPGDVVRLSAGDMIPADLRLISAKDLFINQAALTGDAMPSEKSAEAYAAYRSED